MQFNKIFSVVIIFVILLQIAPLECSANEIPNAFWKLSEQYAEALENQNSQGIIQHGWEIVHLFDNKAETQTILDIVTPRLEQIAKAYETIGDYDNAVMTFKRYIPKAEKQGWTDGVIYAQSKIQALDFNIKLFTTVNEIDEKYYYGAKYEPRTGVYFGSTYDLDTRINTFEWDKIKNYFPKKNAAYLIYVDWGEKVSGYDRHFRDAKSNGIAVELAWNTYDSQTMQEIKQDEQYIKETAKYLKQLEIPIFLRFANEMNIGENGDDSQAYIQAFRYVSGIMKETAPNVAMVWSPNDISASGRTYAQYYPGDAYVDWVGLSAYTYKYFQGKKDWGSQQDTIDSVYFTGDYANPIAKIKAFMEEYGIKKPVMLSETGIGHYAKKENEDLTEWATIQMKRLYIYGPMLYPQLKGMYYFNVDGDTITPKDDYSLYHNSSMHKLYNALVDNPYFISQVGSDADFQYKEITNFANNGYKISLMTYAIPPKVLAPTVKYKIDGEVVATKTEIPYTMEQDFTQWSKGIHKLSIEVYNGTQKLKAENYDVLVGDNKVRVIKSQQNQVQNRLEDAIALFIGSPRAYTNNQEVLVEKDDVSIKPFVVEGRTLVPVRFISEKLGAEVDWDKEISTVTVNYNNKNVKLVLGSTKMLINGTVEELEVPAQTVNGRTFIPLRALTEALGKKVFYDRKLIIISDWENIMDKEIEKSLIDSIISLF